MKMKVRLGSVFPYHNNTNIYISIMKRIFVSTNSKIKKTSKVEPLIKKYDFISLNWVENHVVCESSAKSFAKFLLMYLYIFILSLRTNIIWTMHNKKPHNSKKFESKLSISITNLIIRRSKFILVHSKESIDILSSMEKDVIKKVRYLPHPNYINVYGETLPPKTKSNVLRLLFVGAISRYKNLDILIQVVKDLNYSDVELTIQGKVDTEYKHELIELIGDFKNITTKFQFVEDSDFPQIFSNHHILVTPYDLASSLNSGTNILAFSYQRTVLGPLNGTLKDMDSIKENFFSYEYNSKKEHITMLKNELIDIHEKYKNDYNQILLLGENCYEYVLKNNNEEILSESLIKYLDEFI